MADKLRAKMRVNQVTTRDYGQSCSVQKTLTAGAVCARSDDPDDPNKAWSAATPSGSLELVVTNTGAFGTIDELAGKEILVTIEVVEKPTT